MTPKGKPWYDGGMNDLGLNLSDLTRTGRRAIPPPEVSLVREVTADDLEMLRDAPRGSVAPERKRMTERHHALARALASGLTDGEAAAVIGYEQSTVSILKQSPAFQDLLTIYRNAKDLEFAETMGQVAGLAKDAVLEIRRRVEEEPEKIGLTTLVDIATKTLDRAGYAPQTKSEVKVTVDISSRLAAARQRARAAALGMKDVTPEEDDG